MSATTGYRRFEEELRPHGGSRRRRTARIDDPLIRQRLAQYHTKIQILRINGLRSLTADGEPAARIPASPRSAPTNKMFWSEMHRDAMELALDIFGAVGDAVEHPARERLVAGDGMRAKGRDGYHVSPMMSAFFFSRSETIWGGTAEIQRNIVGERVLGLPREPKVEQKG